MRKIPTACLLCLLILLLAGCAGPGASGVQQDAAPGQGNADVQATAEPTPPPTPSPSPDPVVFAAGEAAWDTEELEMTLQPGETALLDSLSRLRVLDTRGSVCYRELCAWSKEHPEVEVLFSVPVPGLGELDSDTETLDLTEKKPEEILKATESLGYLPKLRELRLPAGEEGLDLDQALSVAEKLPEAVIAYPFTIYGKEADLSDTELVLFHTRVYDQGEEVRRVLPGMHACTWLDMDSCGVDKEHMAQIRDENPDVDVIWRVWFGTNYSVRTNVTKILASMPSKGGALYDSVGEQLQYCTKVRYLDLGHNDGITDFSFIRNMPDLEVVIISMTGISDLSPFTACHNLLYMEAGNTRIGDLSPLAECKTLKHLNIGTNANIRDITPLYDLDLKRLWIGSYTPVPADQVAEMQERHPACIINTTAPSGLERDANGAVLNEGFILGWKNYQNYLTEDWAIYAATHAFPSQRPIGWFKVIFKCFEYNKATGAYAFSWNDPLFNAHEPGIPPVNTKVIDTSFLNEDWEDPSSIIPDVLEDPPGETLYESEH